MQDRFMVIPHDDFWSLLDREKPGVIFEPMDFASARSVAFQLNHREGEQSLATECGDERISEPR